MTGWQIDQARLWQPCPGLLMKRHSRPRILKYQVHNCREGRCYKKGKPKLCKYGFPYKLQVLIDLGKACYITEAKKYSLSNEEKKKYISDHPQIAPELRNGHCKQSEASDVYSVGRIINIVNRQKLSIPALNTMSQNCLQYQSTNRPSSTDLFTSLTFLLE